MADKISRTVPALLCAFMILLTPLGGCTRRSVPANNTEDRINAEAWDSQAADEIESGGETQEAGPEDIEYSDTEPPQESSEEPTEEQNAEPEPDTENSEGMAGYENLAAAYALESNERVVRTFAELKDALAANNGVTVVHLGANITMGGGININNSKAHVIVDGIDPTNPDQVEPYTLTDLNSATFTDTIYINSSGVKNVLVRDLKIVGKNYYGPFSAYNDATYTSGLTLTFERVDYNGPQLGYHRQGTLRIVDCKVRLHGGNGICRSEEFAETKYLVFEGANTIDTATSETSIFWHPGGGTFTVADDSSVTLRSPNTSGAFYMFYAGGSAIGITIGQRSVFDATIVNSVASTAQATFSSLTVREGGRFYLTTTGPTDRTVFSMGGNITVEPDAIFRINSYGKCDYPVLDLITGNITVGKDATFHIVSANTNSSLLNLYGRSLICNDPASVLFHNPDKRDIMATTNPGRVYVDAEQINYWDKSSPGGLDNQPRYRWKKADGTNIRIDGALTAGADKNFSSVSSNYAAGDLPGTAPSTDTFNMVSARVLAFGRLELTVNTPVTTSAEITGITAPGATVRASFSQQGVNYTMSDVTADEDGTFVIPVGISLRPLTDITVRSSYQYLTATYTASVGDTGSLTFTAPDQLQFYTASLAPTTQTVKRLRADWHLLVSDTRGNGNTWSIFARELQPLTPADPSKPALENALVFVGDTGVVTPLGTSGTLLIYRHTAATAGEMVNISWASDRGILARIPTGAAYANQTYAGVIEWSLVDAP